MICPDCKGKGKQFCHHNTGSDSSEHFWGDVICHRCAGSGDVPDEMADWISRGAKMRKARTIVGVSLLEKANALGITPAELCKIEMGKVPN